MMKKIIIASLIMLFTNAIAFSQTKTDTIYAKGNCEHCKERIEETVKALAGVELAVWDPSFGRLICKYNSQIISNDNIQKAIANAGHDTDKYRADDKVYKNLPGCCKYERDVIEPKGSKVQTFEFVIEGMTCAEGCAKGIELSVLKQKGVKSSVVNYDTKRAKVIFDSSKISKEKIIELVEGYRPEGEAPHYKVMLLK